jgi:hypothetical protein
MENLKEKRMEIPPRYWSLMATLLGDSVRPDESLAFSVLIYPAPLLDFGWCETRNSKCYSVPMIYGFTCKWRYKIRQAGYLVRAPPDPIGGRASGAKL